MKNLFDSMMEIANYTLSCALDIGEYQLGLTQLSDWDEKEYKTLLGEKISDNIDNEYNNRKQKKSSGNRSSSSNLLGSLNPLSGGGGGNRNRGNNNGNRNIRLKRAIEVVNVK